MNYTEAKARFTGRFLEPIDGIIVKCPLHGNLGRSSPGGELFCPTCMEWFPAMPMVPLAGQKLKQKQAALQARLARKANRANNRTVKEARKRIRLNQVAKRAKRLGVDPDVLGALTDAQQQALEDGRRRRLGLSKSGLEDTENKRDI